MGEPAPTPGNPAADLRSLHDELRTRGSVVRHEGSGVVLGHDEVVAAAQDPSAFSSRVTARRAIPNALDGAEHAAYRAVVDRYLTTERVDREEEQCRHHVAAIVDGLARGRPVDAVAGLGLPYVRAQSTWLGWAPDLEEELVGWVADNHAATRSGDRTRTAEVAERFDRFIRRLLDELRGTSTSDVTAELMGDRVDGRPLTDEEVVSILRNWTAGDLASLAASIGVIAHQLATTPTFQDQVRSHVRADDRDAVTAAVLEMLRIDDPFVSNRRVTSPHRARRRAPGAG